MVSTSSPIFGATSCPILVLGMVKRTAALTRRLENNTWKGIDKNSQKETYMVSALLFAEASIWIRDVIDFTGLRLFASKTTICSLFVIRYIIIGPPL
jgi:hypothetical protein